MIAKRRTGNWSPQFDGVEAEDLHDFKQIAARDVLRRAEGAAVRIDVVAEVVIGLPDKV